MEMAETLEIFWEMTIESLNYQSRPTLIILNERKI